MPGWQFRPAKHMQRLMAVDVMRRLGAFRPISDYRYLGMGGYEFIDFDLVWRALGITRMTSIESSSKTDRFVFNKPFPDIRLEFGTTNDMLPLLALDAPLIVWLDYCSAVRGNELRDILLLAEKMIPGSMLLVSVNADPGAEDRRLARFEDRVTPERVPLDVRSDADLDGWSTAEIQRRVLFSEVRAALGSRNDGVRFEQLLNVQYRDTTRMQTWGGVFVDAGTEAKFLAADFRSLHQVRTDDEALKIRVPILTAREVLNLEERLVAGQGPPTFPWLKNNEAESFSDLHRWYPRVPAPM